MVSCTGGRLKWRDGRGPMGEVGWEEEHEITRWIFDGCLCSSAGSPPPHSPDARCGQGSLFAHPQRDNIWVLRWPRRPEAGIAIDFEVYQPECMRCIVRSITGSLTAGKGDLDIHGLGHRVSRKSVVTCVRCTTSCRLDSALQHPPTESCNIGQSCLPPPCILCRLSPLRRPSSEVLLMA